MSIPGTSLPKWGGALGKIATAIKNVATAHEKSDSDDARLQVAEGGVGDKRFSLIGDFDGGGGAVAGGGPYTVVTGIGGIELTVEGAKMKIKLTLLRKDIELDSDGKLTFTGAESDSFTAELNGKDCSGGDDGGEGGEGDGGEGGDGGE